MDFYLNKKEKEYLRNLAKKQLEYSALDIMKKREKLWFDHNELKTKQPLIVMEEETFWPEVRPKFFCKTSFGQKIENQLLQNIFVYEKIGDDKVIPNFFRHEINLTYDKFGVHQKKHIADEGTGFHIEPILETIEEDFEKLSPSNIFFDRKIYNKEAEVLEDTIGDILKIKPVNISNYWDFTITQHIVNLMGTENMFCSMMIEPEYYLKLMDFITEDLIRLLRYEEKNNLIFLNNGNDYMGSGSFCFNNELTGSGTQIKSTDTWGHLNSQESVGISSETFKEFVLPSNKKLAKEFGLIYYGCCEPVSSFWDDGIEEIPNIRKVSISPWCDEKMMSDRLSGKNIIYSRKPSPNFIGITKNFDEESFRKYIQKTVSLTKNCFTEFIFRDIYSLNGNIEKIKKAVEIVREEIGEK